MSQQGISNLYIEKFLKYFIKTIFIVELPQLGAEPLYTIRTPFDGILYHLCMTKIFFYVYVDVKPSLATLDVYFYKFESTY